MGLFLATYALSHPLSGVLTPMHPPYLRSAYGVLAANLYSEQFEVQKFCNLNAAATSFQRHVLRGRASHRVS